MSDTPDLETMVRELYEIEQIKKLKYKNLRLLDLKRWDEMGETFAEDATTSWVDGKLVFEGRVAIMEFLKKTPLAAGKSAIGVHQPAAGEIELTSETTARGTWRLYNPLWWRHSDQGYLLLAFYHDTYVKVNGEWKIQSTGHEYILEEFWDRADIPSLKVNAQHDY